MKCAGGLVSKSCLTLATPWTVACQAPLSMEFSRQKYWSGLPFPFSGIFPTQGSNPGLLHCRQILSRQSHQGSPKNTGGRNMYMSTDNRTNRVRGAHTVVWHTATEMKELHRLGPRGWVSITWRWMGETEYNIIMIMHSVLPFALCRESQEGMGMCTHAHTHARTHAHTHSWFSPDVCGQILSSQW